MLLKGKRAVVLGASSGIGWAIAQRFAEHGAQVVIAARRKENLDKLAGLTGAIPIQCDGRDFEDLERLAATTVERLGGVDIAVNSAGVVRSSLIRDVTPEVLQEVAAVQYFG